MRVKLPLFVFSFAALLFISVAPASAHKVYLFAWAEGDSIHCEAYFSKSRKVKNGKISVFAPDGTSLVKGVTDDKGLFSFKIANKTDLRLELDAGMGHKTEFIITADELFEPSPASTSAPEPSAGQESTASAAAPTQANPPVAATVQLTRDQIQNIVEKALDKKLAPLTRAVAELKKEEGPGMVEIVGGIGWIFGIMGLAIYFRRPKK